MVERMPDAAPACASGALAMTADVMGAETSPIPRPAITKGRRRAEVLRPRLKWGRVSRKPAAVISMPAEMSHRLPTRSDSQPESGEATTTAALRGVSSRPVLIAL